jgi:threonine/homoserine/homoserine lactone efflux protein
MDPTTALIAGLAAGAAIAIQVGAVSLLLVETSVVGGPRIGLAAGMGVATVDLAFAAIAVAAGGLVGAALASHEAEIRLVAAAVLAGIAIHGLIGLRRARSSEGDDPHGADERPLRNAAREYMRFIAITAANPLTIASFAAVAASLSLGGPAAAVAFAAGVGIASGGWHLILSLAAGHAGRWITERVRLGLAVGGRMAVLAIAAHLAVAA